MGSRSIVGLLGVVIAFTSAACSAPDVGGLRPGAGDRRSGSPDDAADTPDDRGGDGPATSGGVSGGSGASGGGTGGTGGGAGTSGGGPGGAQADPAPPANAALDAYVAARLDRLRTPGLAAAIVKGPDLKWMQGFGKAHIANGVAVTPDTLFELASVSKTVTAAAVMKLVETGAFGLRDSLDGLLPFPVRNPRFPATAVTPLMLLTHTSSIVNGQVDYQVQGDTPITLEAYARGFVTPGGAYYAASNWANRAPGAGYSYSNPAVALAGYLVQVKSGVSFEEYTRRALFAPLGMNESSWRIAGLDPAHIAMPYTGAPGAYRAAGLYAYPDFPAGSLRTSVKQLSAFLRMFMNDGVFRGVRVLEAATVAEMKKVHVPKGAESPDQGLVWYYEDVGGKQVLGHNGSNEGVSTIMGFDPQTGIGAIVLTNGSAWDDRAASDQLVALFAYLLAEGAKL